MALEKVLLESCTKGIAPNTLHLLEFYPCVLLGYSQSVEEEADEEFCRNNGIEINRRISGGGAIYMDSGTLGWEIIAKKTTPGIPGRLEEMYRKLCGALVSSLLQFGIHALYRPLNDVEIEGRKISGTGGTELDDSFIFHGTILVDFHADIMANALKIPVKKQKYSQISDFKQRTVCMRELLGYVPPMEEVKKSLAGAFAETLGIEFETEGLYPEEVQSMNRETPLFGSEAWIYRRQFSA
jgi:lipoate-protein ligase A